MSKKYADSSKKKVKWAVKNYSNWRVHAMKQDKSEHRLVDANVHVTKSLNKSCFSFALCKFITEVIKVNGEEYPPKGMVYCIQMFLHAKPVFWFILDCTDEVFLDVYYIFDNKMKRCSSEGLGNVKCCTPVSITIEDKLWKEGKLGEENGTVLVHKVLFLLV